MAILTFVETFKE